MTEMTDDYSADSIQVLEGLEAVRKRPGMYLGDPHDGSALHHCIWEVVDNSVDEHLAGHTALIEVNLHTDGSLSVRDYGRGIPLGKVIDCVSKINTGAKYDSKVFKKSVGLNGVGTKAANALSSYFRISSFRDGQTKVAEFSQCNIVFDEPIQFSSVRKGTKVSFIPDKLLFGDYTSYSSKN